MLLLQNSLGRFVVSSKSDQHSQHPSKLLKLSVPILTALISQQVPLPLQVPLQEHLQLFRVVHLAPKQAAQAAATGVAQPTVVVAQLAPIWEMYRDAIGTIIQLPDDVKEASKYKYVQKMAKSVKTRTAEELW